MKIGTPVTPKVGRWKGRNSLVHSKKGKTVSKNEIVIRVIDGPVIVINKSFVALTPKS